MPSGVTYFMLVKNLQSKLQVGEFKAILTSYHRSLKTLSDEEIKDEILKTEDLIREYLSEPKLLRPPYGATNIKVNKIIQVV